MEEPIVNCCDSNFFVPIPRIIHRILNSLRREHSERLLEENNTDDSRSSMSSMTDEEHPTPTPCQYNLLENHDALLHILDYVTPLELSRLCMTCRAMNELASDDRLWAKFFKTKLNQNTVSSKFASDSFKVKYCGLMCMLSLPCVQ